MNRVGGRWLHYDKAGEPIEWLAWAELVEQGLGRRGGDEYRRVGSTHIGEVWVSTVWTGIDMNFLGIGPPIIFETMCFGPAPYGDACTRYSTQEEAVAGHLRTVEDVQAARPLWFEATEDANGRDV